MGGEGSNGIELYIHIYIERETPHEGTQRSKTKGEEFLGRGGRGAETYKIIALARDGRILGGRRLCIVAEAQAQA